MERSMIPAGQEHSAASGDQVADHMRESGMLPFWREIAAGRYEARVYGLPIELRRGENRTYTVRLNHSFGFAAHGDIEAGRIGAITMAANLEAVASEIRRRAGL